MANIDETGWVVGRVKYRMRSYSVVLVPTPPYYPLPMSTPNIHTTRSDSEVLTIALSKPPQFQVAPNIIYQYKPIWARGEMFRGDDIEILIHALKGERIPRIVKRPYLALYNFLVNENLASEWETLSDWTGWVGPLGPATETDTAD